jgi:hypothetical protein
LEELLALRANAPEAERFRTYAAVMNFDEKKAYFTSDPTLKQKMYLKALEWHKKTEPFLPFIKDTDVLRSYHGILYRVYSGLGDYRGALKAHERYVLYRDSLVNRKAQQSAIESRYLYEWQQREKAIF